MRIPQMLFVFLSQQVCYAFVHRIASCQRHTIPFTGLNSYPNGGGLLKNFYFLSELPWQNFSFYICISPPVWEVEPLKMEIAPRFRIQFQFPSKPPQMGANINTTQTETPALRVFMSENGSQRPLLFLLLFFRFRKAVKRCSETVCSAKPVGASTAFTASASLSYNGISYEERVLIMDAKDTEALAQQLHEIYHPLKMKLFQTLHGLQHPYIRTPAFLLQ